jgi:hypothetical protein
MNSISVGTLASDVLTWVVAVFGVPIGTLLTAWLYRLFVKAGVDMTDAMRARLQEIVINGLNFGAKIAEAEMAGKGQIAIKNAAVAHAISYVQEQGAAELKKVGVDPYSGTAVHAIIARIETAITDASAPTPKILDAPPALPISATQRT